MCGGAVNRQPGDRAKNLQSRGRKTKKPTEEDLAKNRESNKKVNNEVLDTMNQSATKIKL